MKLRAVVRRERWLTLLEVADLMKLPQQGRAARRRAVLRLVRMAERVNSDRITKLIGNKVYVSTFRLEDLFPLGDERIFNVESALSDLHRKHNILNDRVKNHGSRLGKVERQQALTHKFLADYMAVE